MNDLRELCDRQSLDEFIKGLLTPLSIYIKQTGKSNDYYEWLWDNRVLMRSQSVAFKITTYLKSKRKKMTMNKQLRKLVVFLLDESREVALVLLVVFSLPAAVYTSLFFIELMVSGGVGDPEKVLDFVRMTRFFLPSAIVVLLSSILIIGTYVYSWLHDHRENTNRVPIIHHLYIAAGYQYDGRNYSRFWLYPAPWPITVAMRVAGLIGLVCMLIAIAATFPKSVLLAAAVVLGLFAIRSHIRKTNRE